LFGAGKKNVFNPFAKRDSPTMKGPDPPKQERPAEDVNKSKISSVGTGVNASGLSNIKPVSVGLNETEIN
jgi:hypothetical protein